MDSDQKIREFLNNEDTKEIVNFLFDLPTPAFKFWGGLIKQSYKSKILEGSGVLEALKIEEEQKELRKEAAILALLLKGNLLKGIVNWSGVTRSVVCNRAKKVPLTTDSVCNKCPLFQLEKRT